MSAPSPSCPSCGANLPNLLGKLPDNEWFAGKKLERPLRGGSLYRCAQCLLKFRFPLADAATYHALYDNAETTTWSAISARPDWDLILSQIDALKPQGGSVLDFGCYSGGLLARLDSRHERYGIEVNRGAARVTQERTGAQVWSGLGEIPSGLRFDIIVIADVIEHLPNPLDLLERLGARLAEDGVIIITTGDADARLWNRFGSNWWYCFYPEHIVFVSCAWAGRALPPKGWSILLCQSFQYHHFGRGKRAIEYALTCAYGLAPRLFLYVGNTLKRWFGRGAMTSVPGNGVSADHLLIAVTRNRPP